MVNEDIRSVHYVAEIRHLFYRGHSRDEIIQELPDEFQDFAPHEATVNYCFDEFLRDRTTVYFERLPTDPIDKVDCTGDEDFVLHENFFITKLADGRELGPDAEKERSPSSPPAVEEAFARLEINGQTNGSAAKGEEPAAVVVSSEKNDTKQRSASFSSRLDTGKVPLANDEVSSDRADSPPGPVELDGQSSPADPFDSMPHVDRNAIPFTNMNTNLYDQTRPIRRVLYTVKPERRQKSFLDHWHVPE